jgi:uncharacterized protein YbjT (DUF2867 family)
MKKLKPDDIITIIGGSGFLGKYVISELIATTQAKIKVIARNPYDGRQSYQCKSVGQVGFIAGDVLDDAQLEEAIKGSTYVINLVGILFEKGKQNFANIHALLPGRIGKFAAQHNVKRVIHISALGDSSAKYAQTKRQGEKELLANFPRSVILRPSVLVGPEDKFTNLFAKMLKMSPIMPLIYGGASKLQPVYVADVAKAIVAALVNDTVEGKILEIAGSVQYTLKELVQYIATLQGTKRCFIKMPTMLAYVLALGSSLLPAPIITFDQMKLLKYDNILSGQNGLKILGIEPTMLEMIMPKYLQSR